MSTTDRKLRVFLCHASQDKPVVRELYQRLLAEGWIDPWLDEINLLPGQNWDIEIEKAVEGTHAVLVCLSKNSVTKEGYIQAELSFALDIARTKPEDTIFIVPLRLDDCQVPRRLRIWQHVDYFPEHQKDKTFGLIVKSLDNRKKTLDKLGESSSDREENGFLDDQKRYWDKLDSANIEAQENYKEIDDNGLPSELGELIYLVHSVSAPRVDSDGVERRGIQVIVDSFSDRVLDEIEKVEYHLHPSFPNPVRVITDRERRFELKTRGWGEFNLSANVYIKKYEKPLTLYRYINFQNY